MRRSPLLLSILAVLPACREEEGCFEVDPSLTACPSRSEVAPDDLWLPGLCGYDIVGVRSEGERKDVGTDIGTIPACCYTVAVVDPDPFGECIVGRPYREDAGALLAEVGRGGGAVARAWLRAAAGEHASVAAFARLALQLLAHGAPLDLLTDVHAAAADEVRHARACLDEASRHGAEVALGAFPFGGPVEVQGSLALLAAEAVREGCLAETLAAHVVAVAAAHAPDPRVRAVLAAIAEDEGRHAVLSWRIAAWAVSVGGAEVRAAVREALSGPVPGVDLEELALRSGVDPSVLAEGETEGRAQVLLPAARALAAA